MYHCAMAALPIQLDRARKSPLAAQIYSAIREGIENGRLASGARLPSWQDLAAQLGVSRGTVRVAYGRLIAEQFAIGLGPAGTRVAERQSGFSITDWSPEAPASAGYPLRVRKRTAGISDGRARSRRLPVQAVVAHPDS
jgi:GntR family transcriptional regulator / MocR family aminotransferase